MSADNPQAAARATPRTWLLRAGLAIAVPVALLLALESGLRVAGYGGSATFLIPDSKPGYFRTNPAFASLFLPGSFDLRPLNFRVLAHKPSNTVRIVVLGESAAQGVPVPSFAFAAQLRAQLRARYPGRVVEVLDTGIVAINSHVVYQVAREMARFEPDLFVVYMGNNEVVGPYGPGCAYLSQMPPLWVIRASVFVRSTRTGQLIGSLAARLFSRRRDPAQWGGMSMFVNSAVAGDDPRLEAVYANYAANLRGIVDAASGAGAKTILCTVVANLKDCPPFLSRHRPGLSAAELSAFKAGFGEGRLAWMLGENDRARGLLSGVLKMDPQYADTHFMLGSLDLQAGDVDSARKHFVEALHWDALRFRPDPRINQIVRTIARGGDRDVILVDCAMALGSDGESTAAPSGREILFEHVHFDWNGNYRVARMMAQGCEAALTGGDRDAPARLDSAGCADALAYTAHERLPMLLGIDVLVRRPPFTNQLTYVADQARMAREIDAATRERVTPAALGHAAQVARAALAGDPGNPALAGILEGIDLDLGDTEGALSLARRAKEMLPGDAALSADEASILMRLGRFAEAEKVLMASAGSGADLDRLAPVLADFWTRTRRFDEGGKFFARAIARNPADRRIRLARAGLLGAAGDSAGAEREYRALLALDFASQEALEALVGLLDGSGRTADAEKESLAAAGIQRENQVNSLRAAKIYEARGDEEHSVQFMEAAAAAGPVNATFELTVALKLYKLGRMEEMMPYLAEARSLSKNEGNPAVTESIGSLIARMRAEMLQAGRQPR
jgi:tetratricopeptide (TPR) repeat protein